jgi:1-phosphofructokinase
MNELVLTVGLNPAIDRVIELPRLVPGSHQSGREVLRAAGGKSLNVSRCLAELGVVSRATGFLGEENLRPFSEFLRGRGIAEDFVVLPGRTRENITLVDRSGGEETHIRDEGLAVDAGSLAVLARKIGHWAGAGRWIAFCGSLPPGAGPAELAGRVAAARQAGAKVAVDASGRALAAAVEARPHLIKPNAVELAALLGRPTEEPPPDAAAMLSDARGLLDRVDRVLLSHGGEGAYLIEPRRTLHAKIEVPAERIRNTVGCGDALLGGFLAAEAEGRGGEDALAQAVACATAAAMSLGPAEFEAAEAVALKKRVRLSEIK